MNTTAGSHTAPLPAVGLVMGSCASLQGGAALATQLFPHAGSWGVTFLRLLFAGALLAAFIPIKKVAKWGKEQWLPVTLFGLSLGFMNGFFYAAIARIPLGIAVTIEFLGPLLLSAALSRKMTDFLWVLLACSGLVLLGVDSYLTSDTSASLDPLGVVFALIAGGFWVGYILLSKRVGVAVPGTAGLTVALFIGAIALAPLGTPHVGGILSSPALIGLAFATAFLASVLPYTLELAALRQLPPAIFGILLSLEPVFATLAGWLLLHQQLGMIPLLAIAFVVSASIGTTVSNRPQPLRAHKPIRQRLTGLRSLKGQR